MNLRLENQGLRPGCLDLKLQRTIEAEVYWPSTMGTDGLNIHKEWRLP
jgi:hypothetical protein